MKHFQREVNIFSKIYPQTHPNIVDLVGLEVGGKQPSILMVFCPLTLEQHMCQFRESTTSKALLLPAHIELMSQLTHALEFLHARGILHR